MQEKVKGKRRSPDQVRERDHLGRKQCGHCLDWLPESAFRKVNSIRPGRSSDGLDLRCRECVRYRMHHLTRQDIAVLLEGQDHRCALCQKSFMEHAFEIDHDHGCCPWGTKSCGQCVRGLLCIYCNRTVLGVVENEALLQGALEYLGKTNG